MDMDDDWFEWKAATEMYNAWHTSLKGIEDDN